MAAVVEVKRSNATIGDIKMQYLWQKANVTLKEYWEASDSEYEDYLAKYELDLESFDWNIDNVEQLNQRTAQFIEALTAAVAKDIGKFDFRLRSALSGNKALLQTFNTSEYSKLGFDLSNLSEDMKDIVINKLQNAISRSFIDFREYDKDNDIFIIVYHRRGIADEGERLAVPLARDTVTLLDKFEQAKSVNYVASGLCSELAEEGLDVKYIYTDSAGNLRENTKTAKEILDVVNIKQIAQEQNVKIAEIKEQVKEELKEERAKTRVSLQPDSNKTEITKPAREAPNLVLNKFDREKLSAEDLNTIVEFTIQNYELNEKIKVETEIKKSRSEAATAYQTAKNKISQGKNIAEILNEAMQLHKNSHTVNILSTMLTKDFFDISLKEEKISKMQKQIDDLKSTVEQKETAITTREQEVSKLRSTLTTKEKEFSLASERFNEQLNTLVEENKKVLNEATELFEKEIDAKEKTIIEQDEIISAAKNEDAIKRARIQSLETEISKETAKKEELIGNNATLKVQNDNLQEQIEGIQSKLNTKEQIIIEQDEIISAAKNEDAIKRARIQSLETENTTLKEQIEKFGELAKQSDEAISVVKRELDSMKEANTMLVMRNKNMSEENVKLLGQVEFTQQEIIEKNKTIEALSKISNKYDIILGDRDKLLNESVLYKQSIAKLEEINATLSKQNEELKKLLQSSKTTSKASKNAIDAIDSINDKNIKNIADEIGVKLYSNTKKKGNKQ